MNPIAIVKLADLPNLGDGPLSDYPQDGIVVAVYNPTLQLVNNRQAATDATGVTYDVLVQTTLGSFLISGAPAQNRWDCWVYVSQPGHIAELHWFGDTVRFTVLEIPVTEDCTGGVF